jgi:hypothetical protein
MERFFHHILESVQKRARGRVRSFLIAEQSIDFKMTLSFPNKKQRDRLDTLLPKHTRRHGKKSEIVVKMGDNFCWVFLFLEHTLKVVQLILLRDIFTRKTGSMSNDIPLMIDVKASRTNLENFPVCLVSGHWPLLYLTSTSPQNPCPPTKCLLKCQVASFGSCRSYYCEAEILGGALVSRGQTNLSGDRRSCCFVSYRKKALICVSRSSPKVT